MCARSKSATRCNLGSLMVAVGSIMPKLFLVSTGAQNLMWVVIVVAMDSFTFVFNIIEAFLDNGANLMSGSAIIIWLEWMDGS